MYVMTPDERPLWHFVALLLAIAMTVSHPLAANAAIVAEQPSAPLEANGDTEVPRRSKEVPNGTVEAQSPSAAEVTPVDLSIPPPAGADPVMMTLWAGRHMEVGDFVFWYDEDALYVTYKTNGDWYMTGMHLHVSETPPEKLNPGGFEHRFPPSGRGAYTGYTFQVPIVVAPGGSLYIAAHAEVLSSSGGHESAWGGRWREPVVYTRPVHSDPVRSGPIRKAFRLTISDPPTNTGFCVRYEALGDGTVTVPLAKEGEAYLGAVEVDKDAVLMSPRWYARWNGIEILLRADPDEVASSDMTNTCDYDAHLAGGKFEDDGHSEGRYDSGEAWLPDWTVRLYRRAGADWVLFGETETRADGSYRFEDVLPGTYKAEEVLEDGWRQTLAPPPGVAVENGTRFEGLDFGNVRSFEKTFRLEIGGLSAGAEPHVHYSVDGGPGVRRSLTLADGSYETTMEVRDGCEISNVEWHAAHGGQEVLLGRQGAERVTGDMLNLLHYDSLISGTKYLDMDGDGDADDEGEGPGEGWTIGLCRMTGGRWELYGTALTGADGSYRFEDVLPGTYRLDEVDRAGFHQVSAPQGTVTIDVSEQTTEYVGLDFCNGPAAEGRSTVDLALRKSADRATAGPGDVVEYTVEYSVVLGGPARDFTVSDDYDERYVTVVDADGGDVEDGRIVWEITRSLSSADGTQALTCEMRVKRGMPEGTTLVRNVATVNGAEDGDPSNDSDGAEVMVEDPYEPRTPSSRVRKPAGSTGAGSSNLTLPFTNGRLGMLLMICAVLAVAGRALKKASHRAA